MGMIGNTLAQGLISGANIQDGTVDTPDLKDSVISTAKIADAAVTAAKLSATAITDKLGFTPYNASANPSGFISGINSSMVTTALGFTPYNSSNPSGYITSSALSSYLPLSGGTVTGVTTFSNSSDVQVTLSGAGTSWAGILWSDVSGSDYTYFNGSTGTFSIGGTGTAVSGKKLHVHGGMTIGSGYAPIGTPTNGLNVQGAIQQAGDQVLHAGNYASYALPLYGGTLTGPITTTTATFTNDLNSRVLYLRGAGNIIQFQDAGGTNLWETVGRNGTYYIFKNYGTGGGFKFQISDSGGITINNGSTTNVVGTLQQDGNQVLNAANYNGYARFRTGVDRVYHSNGGELAVLGTVWKEDHNATYIHVKTNLHRTSHKMIGFRLTGYFSYNAYASGFLGCYTYGDFPFNGSTYEPYGVIAHNNGSGVSVASGMYYSSDGFLVLRLYWPTSYMGVLIVAEANGGNYGSTTGLGIVGYAASNNVTGVY